MSKKLTTNAVIGRLCENDKAVIIQASTRALGLTYCISDTFELVDRPVVERLISKGVLVEAGDAKGAHCIVGKRFALADGWRAPAC